ncbi:hypothetical protein ACFXHA_43800 [Nocardia sp. NPDC059240]|uniref:hypothetical protein n=1 Tax=Nocardia sp. NPDC059240 TaxID=3346786 RepID=UPI0036920A6C
MAAGGLLILLAVLFVVGSLLKLAEFRGAGNPSNGLEAFHTEWGAWSLANADVVDSSGATQQWLGIPMIVAALAGAVGAVLLLTGLATRRRGALGVAVAAAAMTLGVAAATVADVVSALITSDSTVTTSLGAGFWIFAVSLPIAVVALVAVAIGGAATRPNAPVDSAGRPLGAKAGGLDIVVGILLIPLAGLTVAATFFEQSSGVSLWSAWNHETQISGAVLVAGAAGALIAAVLSFVGRGRLMASACAAILFASGLLLSVDTVDLELSGPVQLSDFKLGAWLLFASTAIALLVTVLAVLATATKPGFRTPYAPFPQQYPGWAPPQGNLPGQPQPAPAIPTPPPTWVQPPQVPQAWPQHPAPPQPVWPQPEQGWEQPPQAR